MTRRDFCIKWMAYAIALLPVWFLETMVLNRFPLLGVTPMLLPSAAIAVAVLEGAVAGAGFGLATGMLCDGVYFSSFGGMTLVLALLGTGAGALARYALRQNFAGCLLCSAAAMTVIDAGRVLRRLLEGVHPSVLLALAGKEILWSLFFVLPVYLLFRWVYRRVPESTHF